MGAFLMLACDYRIGLDGDYRVGLNETLIGMTMHHFGIELARCRLPVNYLNRCVFNAEIFSPRQAITAGFYDVVVSYKDLLETTNSAVGTFCKLNMNAFKGSKIKARADTLDLLSKCIQKDLQI